MILVYKSFLMTDPIAVLTKITFILAVVTRCTAEYYYRSPLLSLSNPYGAPYYPPMPSLTVLAEKPYTVDRATVSVPLMVIADENLRVVQNAHIAAVSPTKPYVTIQTHQATTEAMPAVRVVLKKPVYVTSLQSTIAFPAGFTVVHEGLRMPIPVGAVLAPVPTGTVIAPSRPFAITVVYAIPTSPIPFQYPYYPYYPYYPPFQYRPFVTRPVTTITRPVTAVSVPRPVTSTQRPPIAITPTRPSQTPPVVQGRPDAPLIEVLDFPTSVATPPVLFYQPPATGLGNREPPQPVIPAGIVQSTAPEHNLSVFVNSKESPYLQILREEAMRRPRPDY